MTKSEKQYYYQKWAYTKGNKTLTDCYKKPSPAKRKIWLLIEAERRTNRGYNLTILTFNSFMFTCAYEFTINGIPYLRIHTPTEQVTIDILDTVHELENNSRTDEP